MPYRGYRKRGPQWTDSVFKDVKFVHPGLVTGKDKEDNEVRAFTNKVQAVPERSRDTNELQGNLSGIANVAKYEEAREALCPLVVHAVDYLANDTRGNQSAHVKKIDEGIFKGRLKQVMDFPKTYLGKSITSPLAKKVIAAIAGNLTHTILQYITL